MTVQIIILGIMILILLMIIPFGFGAPFQSSSKKRTNKILKMIKTKKGSKAVDLGSGTGRLLIALAKNPNISEIHGYEIKPLLVFISRLRIKKLGLEKRIFVHSKSFWKADLSKFDVITSFQISYVMPKLAKKIKLEAKKSVKIISNTWKFPNWKPTKEDDGVYLYELKNRKHL
jgi:ribosomal protein L11 methylase PrmA